MQEIKNDAFYDFVRQYDPDQEYHIAGEVVYYLLCDDRAYEGPESHREALRFVFERLLEKSTEDRENAGQMPGGGISGGMAPSVCDVGQARPTPLTPREFFYCPNIVRTDYNGNARYDAEWKPGDGNPGTTVPYWYALMEPVQGRRNRPEDFRNVNEALFPNGTDALDIYEWTTDWSDYFDDGHEWYGACCWSVYDQSLDRYVVMLVSATD